MAVFSRPTSPFNSFNRAHEGLFYFVVDENIAGPHNGAVKIETFWSDSIPLNPKSFPEFCQRIANRLMAGRCRYGSPDKRKKYLTRMALELRAYRRNGNAEHLLNIANYCLLEQSAPENPKFHFDNAVESATRRKVCS